jgi:hypothetical protein
MGMSEVPKPFMGCHQALHVTAAGPIRREGSAGEHHFENVQKLLGNLEIALVARVVKGDQDLV